MNQRTNSENKRNELIAIMQEMHQKADNQADFTAEKVAAAAGISRVWLYKLVGPEFKSLRSQLTGPQHPKDEVMRKLRLEVIDLKRQLREAKEKLRTTAAEELDEAIILIEHLEEENLQLRGENKLLRKRLAEGAQVIVQTPYREPSRPNLSIVSGEVGNPDI